MSSRALEAVERILEHGGDADDVLRGVVEALAAEPEISWAGIRFLEDGELVLGPSAGSPDTGSREGGVRLETTIAYRGDRVGELVVDGVAEQRFLDRVATLISAYVLLGWDTGGTAWDP